MSDAQPSPRPNSQQQSSRSSSVDTKSRQQLAAAKADMHLTSKPFNYEEGDGPLPSTVPSAIADEDLKSPVISISRYQNLHESTPVNTPRQQQSLQSPDRQTLPRGSGSKAEINARRSAANTSRSADGTSVSHISGSPRVKSDAVINISASVESEVEAELSTSMKSERVVKRASLRDGSGGNDGSKLSRVYPVSCTTSGDLSTAEGATHLTPTVVGADHTCGNDGELVIPGLGKRLSLQTVQIASRSNSIAGGGGDSVQPLDPSIYRMTYFRTKRDLCDLFNLPMGSQWGRRFNIAVFVAILLNIGELAFETCDGPNMESSQPGYPYLLTASEYAAVDVLFSMIFTVEFIGRIWASKNRRGLLRDPFMWVDFVALCPWYLQQTSEAAGASFEKGRSFGTAHYVSLLRLARTARLADILRKYEQFKILYLSIKASLRPLGITLFFLFTLVMVIATAIFYAEPCYNVETCTFTDIFNSAYFVMVTVATVGYGSQVPNLKNPGSMLLTMFAMILGQIYFAMPVAIIGNNFMRTYDNFQMNKKKKTRYLDATLSPFDCQTLHSNAKRLCDIQYHFLDAWRVVHRSIKKMISSSKSTESWTLEFLEDESDRHIKIKESINRLIGVHAESCQLLQVFIPHKRKSLQRILDSQSQGMLSNMYTKAKSVMNKAKRKSGYPAALDPRVVSQTFRGRLWLALEVPDSSRLASFVNKGMVIFSLVSIMLFFSESLPELAASGEETSGCREVVRGYCDSEGFDITLWDTPDPACYVRLDNGTSDFSQKIDFACSSSADSAACYGHGLNFGSLNIAAPACEDAFNENGVDLVCYRQQCRASADTIADMGPYWIYFEWIFGAVFTAELSLRLYVSQHRKHFWKDFYNIFDVLAVVPFFVEVIQLMFADVTPEYAIVATAPSFLSVIRVLKIMRILKLTRHFRGTKVLASTATKVWKPLVIPLFFLFTGCIIAGAMFYEIERGTECFVGSECLWWKKNILTPELSAGLPVGKRILIQNDVLTTITDMIHSTWLSYTTLTSVGYGDLVPRTAIGKVVCICVVVIATIYSAMPVSLVGTQFYSLYEKHMEKMVVRRGGSSLSWRTKRKITVVTQYANTFMKVQKRQLASPRKPDVFLLSEEELLVAHQFETMRRTILNLQKNLDNFSHVTLDIIKLKASGTDKNARTATLRNTTGLEQSIEQKISAILDTLMQFSQVVEKIQDAPVDFEAFTDEEDTDSQPNIFPNGYSPRMFADQLPSQILE